MAKTVIILAILAGLLSLAVAFAAMGQIMQVRQIEPKGSVGTMGGSYSRLRLEVSLTPGPVNSGDVLANGPVEIK